MRRVLDEQFSDPAGEYPRRIAQQPALYGLARRRMESYPAELAPLTPAEAAAEAAAAKEMRRMGSKARQASGLAGPPAHVSRSTSS